MAKRVKNNVSYFLAGFKAGLLYEGKHSAQDVEEAFYHSIKLPNKGREYLRVYDEVDDFEEADKRMLEYVQRDISEFYKSLVKDSKVLKDGKFVPFKDV